MARTDATAVKAVLAPGQDYDLETNPDLTPFIDTASAVVDDAVESAADNGITITSVRAELIERWLAAHFYKCSDRQFQSETTAGAGGQYTGKTGMNFNLTTYGQTAMSLDPSGTLITIGGEEGRSTATVAFVGLDDEGG